MYVSACAEDQRSVKHPTLDCRVPDRGALYQICCLGMVLIPATTNNGANNGIFKVQG